MGPKTHPEDFRREVRREAPSPHPALGLGPRPLSLGERSVRKDGLRGCVPQHYPCRLCCNGRSRSARNYNYSTLNVQRLNLGKFGAGAAVLQIKAGMGRRALKPDGRNSENRDRKVITKGLGRPRGQAQEVAARRRLAVIVRPAPSHLLRWIRARKGVIVGDAEVQALRQRRLTISDER